MRYVDVLHAVGADGSAYVILPAVTIEIERKARASGA